MRQLLELKNRKFGWLGSGLVPKNLDKQGFSVNPFSLNCARNTCNLPLILLAYNTKSNVLSKEFWHPFEKPQSFKILQFSSESVTLMQPPVLLIAGIAIRHYSLDILAQTQAPSLSRSSSCSSRLSLDGAGPWLRMALAELLRFLRPVNTRASWENFFLEPRTAPVYC